MANGNTNSDIQACVDSFVAELTTLIEKSALDKVLAAVTGAAAPAAKRGAPAKRAKATRKVTRKGGKRVRRSSSDVDEMTGTAQAFIGANAGCSVSEIAAALGVTTKDLRLPLMKLLAAGSVKTKGQKRGTRYHPGRGRPAKKKASKKKATRKKATRKKAGRKKKR